MVISSRNREIHKKKVFLFFFVAHKSMVIFAKNREILKNSEKKCVLFLQKSNWWFVQEIDEIRTKIQKYAWRNHWGFLPKNSEIWKFCVFFTQEIIGDFREKFTNSEKKVCIYLAEIIGDFCKKSMKSKRKSKKVPGEIIGDLYQKPRKFQEFRVLVPDFDLIW